jgi:hypothetical protein
MKATILLLVWCICAESLHLNFKGTVNLFDGDYDIRGAGKSSWDRNSYHAVNNNENVYVS